MGSGAPVYLAVILEYPGAEILELVGIAARDNKKTRIIPRHLQLAVQNDKELNKPLLCDYHSGWSSSQHTSSTFAQEGGEETLTSQLYNKLKTTL